MVYDHCITTAFGLGTFTHIVHDVGIYHRGICHHDGWKIISPQPNLFARQPFLCAMCPKVDYSIGIIDIIDPEVCG